MTVVNSKQYRGSIRFVGRTAALLLVSGAILGAAPSNSDRPSENPVAAPFAVRHGALRRSTPAKGAVLRRVPRELRLTFTEPVERAVARLTLAHANGQLVALGTITVPADSASQLVAAIQGEMTAGRYTVRWQVAGADGHPVRGDFTFDVAPGADGALLLGPAVIADSASRPPREPAPVDTAPASVIVAATPHADMAHHDTTSFPVSGGTFDVDGPAYVAIRWFTYLTVLGLIGAAAFRFAVLGRVARHGEAAADTLIPTAAEASASVGAVASGLLLVAAALRLVAQTSAMHGSVDGLQPAAMLPMISETTWGIGWLMLVASGVIGLVGFLGARRHESWGWRTAAVAGPLAALALALSGHAVAVPRWQGVAVTADVIHVIGAGGWLGSLGVLLIAGVPAARRLEPRLRDAAVATLVRAFSPTALIAAALLSGTGLIAAWLHVGSPSALWSSEYGRLLLIKVGVVALVAITGAYNWRRVLPTLGQEISTTRLQRSARAEVAIAVVVLMITAILVATAPPSPMGG